MFKLNKLTVYGFKTTNKQASVDFSENNISVIFGDNGSGKTSFLKIIYAVLSQKESILKQEKVKTIEIEFTCMEDTTNSIENERKKILITTIQKQGDLDESSNSYYDWSEFERSGLLDSRSISLGVQRGTTVQASYVDPDYIYVFLKNHLRYRLLSDKISVGLFSKELADFLNGESNFLKTGSTRRLSKSKSYSTNFTDSHIFLQNISIENIGELLLNRYKLARKITTSKIQNALFNTLAVAIQPDASNNDEITINNNFREILLSKKERIIEALESLEVNNFKEEIIRYLKEVNHDILNTDISKRKLLIKLLFKMIEELEVEQEILSSINLLVDTFNKFLIEGKQLILEPDKIYVKAGKSSHSVNELSSGERHILTFFTLVLIEGENRDFLIIDEPEISLNIDWQNELLPLFNRLIPKTQIIVASHSPSIIAGEPICLVKLRTGQIKDN